MASRKSGPTARERELQAEIERLRVELTEANRRLAGRVSRSDGGDQFTLASSAAENLRLQDKNSEQLAQIKSMHATLLQTQKSEAIGHLTRGLAHDFNNLLTGIIGGLDLLETRLAQGHFSNLDRYIAIAQGAAKRAAVLTHRLLAFARRQTLDPKASDANRLIHGMEDMIRRTIGPQIELEVVAAGGLWPSLIDPHQLENAVLNLCINARDAMPDDGRLTIETANRWLDDYAARERDVPPGQYVSVCVTDSGTGMLPEVVAQAFDPFFTTKPLGEGTGLGLSMIYGFVRQSGGQVRIYSELDQGTMVCMYLPRHHQAVESVEDLPLPQVMDPLKEQQSLTVMVVDDEPTVRAVVAEVLGDFGYALIEAVDSMAALKVLQSDGRIDLLITDVGLPNQRAAAGRCCAGRSTEPEGVVYHRLRRKRCCA